MQSDKQFQDYFYYHSWDRAGSAKANGREPKTGLDRVSTLSLAVLMMCMYLSMQMHAHIYS
jgi:hypothetical protein